MLWVSLAWTAVASGEVGSYRSRVTGVDPPVPELDVKVSAGGLVTLTNRTGKQLVIRGYAGEPYLRFDASGVYENRRSPAAYLNRDAFGRVTVPPEADPAAAPDWRRVGDGSSYTWHDHRVHWGSSQEPQVVRANPDVRHHLRDWRIPGLVAGHPFAIAGSLDYVPPPAGGALRWLLPLAVPPAAVVAVAYLLRRRRVGGGAPSTP